VSTKWTNDQKRAIDSSAEGILVSAAAGSGKTAVLVERIINAVKNGTDINELLVSTFTKAAAANMREKIYKALASEYAKNPLDKRLRRQLSSVYAADIGTIHSFCVKLIRKNFTAPEFRLISEDEARIMKNRVMSRTLDELFEEGNPDFIEAGDMFVRRSTDKGFSALLLSLYAKLTALPYWEDVLDNAVNSYNSISGDLSEKKFGQTMIEKLNMCAAAYLELYDAIKEQYMYSEVYGGLFSFEYERLQKLSRSDITYDGAYKELSDFIFPSYPRKKKTTIEEEHYTYKSIRDELKDEISSLRENLFPFDSASAAEELMAGASAIRGVAYALKAFEKNYRNEKDSINALDFSDLEHFTLKLLYTKNENGEMEKSALAYDVSRRYKEIFIDEYQDLNSIQECIFLALSKDNGRNLFMVGDVKQSIYGFRQANPNIFLQKYATFSKDESALENACITLAKNFRSRGGVLDAVNMVFENIMSPYVGGLFYGKDEILYKNELFEQGAGNYSPELFIIDTPKDSASGDEEDKSGLYLEAHLAAQRILSIMAGECEVYDVKSGTLRPAKFGDFAILMRSVKNKDVIFEQVLSEYGIPVDSQSKTDFFSAPDVMLVTSILRVIDNPTLDIPLVSIMRSPVFSFDDDEIMQIKMSHGGSMFDAVRSEARDGCKKCERMLDYIDKVRFISKDMTVPELIEYIYETTHIRNFVSGFSDGEMRLMKLDTLYQIACEYEASHYKGLFNFVHVGKIAGFKQQL